MPEFGEGQVHGTLHCSQSPWLVQTPEITEDVSMRRIYLALAALLSMSLTAAMAAPTSVATGWQANGARATLLIGNQAYAGSAVWRIESVSAGQGQPLSNAVRAEIDIPEAKVTVSMIIRKIVEPHFPASHTMEFHFTGQAGNLLGPIKQIYVPELRQDDEESETLAGVPVTVTDYYFMVGLSRGAPEQNNLRLMARRNWFDVSILLKSGEVAKISIEKGLKGQKILEDAIASWRDLSVEPPLAASPDNPPR